MSERKFKVVQINNYQNRVSKNSNREYMYFETSDGKYNCFDMSLADDIIRATKNNPNIEVTYTENMGFKTIVGAAPALSAPLSASVSGETNKHLFHSGENNRQTSIEAQVAFKATVDYWNANKLMLNIDAEKDEFRKTAEFFLSVIEGLQHEIK